ncbi:hypothetical protein EO087_01305 [Dyella sp. M7H15-1]|uniref:trypsin-like serine peptidase n=1 Tax=Dyella sp. M7H15-1 TaxID=2501295 RepID=UPI001004F5C6|nr:hypothetical protein [Dyella sp. M7H15-1]QAU22787.1 hypothetical protein EO087_01305 [Dyella sp. M7H15-1]
MSTEYDQQRICRPMVFIEKESRMYSARRITSIITLALFLSASAVAQDHSAASVIEVAKPPGLLMRHDDPCLPNSPNEVCAGPIESSPEAVVKFWTAEKMRDAVIGGGFYSCRVDPQHIITPGGDSCNYAQLPLPYDGLDSTTRVNGILFYRRPYTAPDGVYTCSASVITSTSGQLILTAAHCLMDGVDGFADMVMFVPAYSQDPFGRVHTPLGRWPIQQSFAPQGWLDRENIRDYQNYDVAIGYVYSAPGTPWHNRLEGVVGAGLIPKLIPLDDFPDLVTTHGYPGRTTTAEGPRYGNGRQYICRSHTQSAEFAARILLNECPGANGNSGGPVVLYQGHVFDNELIAIFTNSYRSTRLTESNFVPLYNFANGLLYSLGQ